MPKGIIKPFLSLFEACLRGCIANVVQGYEKGLQLMKYAFK